MKPNYQALAGQYLFQNYARYPLTLVRGEGVYVWDDADKKYLDFLGGIACLPLGYNPKKVIDALVQQAHKIMHTSNLYFSPPSIELAQWLVQQGGLDRVFFCNSGTEANEAAIKLARKYQYRQGKAHKIKIISAEHSFHGRTFAALAATGKKSIQEGFGPMPAGFIHASWDDADAFCELIDTDVAAVILEPIQGEGGIYVAPYEFLQKVRARCDAVDALLIFDEIQCGIGRTGTLFAYEHFAVKPDIITMAKGIASGLPLGVVCAVDHIAQALKPGDHGTTFGGNPVSCQAALITLQEIVALLDHVRTISAYLFQGLRQLQHEFPQLIKEIRGAGLMIGMSLSIDAAQVLNACQAKGLLLNVTAQNVLRFLPPYIISKADVDETIHILHEVLKQN